MPYMDLEDHEAFQHLIQLFLAAHPQWQGITRALRAQTDLAHEYFVSEAMAEALVPLAIGRHLITPKTGQRLLEAHDWPSVQTLAPW